MEKNQSSSSSSWMSFSSQCQKYRIQFISAFLRRQQKPNADTLDGILAFVCALCAHRRRHNTNRTPSSTHSAEMEMLCGFRSFARKCGKHNEKIGCKRTLLFESSAKSDACRVPTRHERTPHTQIYTNTNADSSSIHSQSQSRARNIWTESDGCWSIAVESWRCRYRCAETNSGQFTRMFSRDKLFPAISSHTHIKCNSIESVRPVIAFWRSQLKCWKIPFDNIFFPAVLSESINERNTSANTKINS